MVRVGLATSLRKQNRGQSYVGSGLHLPGAWHRHDSHTLALLWRGEGDCMTIPAHAERVAQPCRTSCNAS